MGLVRMWELLTRRRGSGKGLIDRVRWVAEMPGGACVGAEDRDVIVQAVGESAAVQDLGTSASYALSSVEEECGHSELFELVEIGETDARSLRFFSHLSDDG